MTQLQFPKNPIPGQLYSAPNGFTYEYDGRKWTAKAVRPSSTSTVTSTSSVVIVPSSNTEGRPSGVMGEIWFDTTAKQFEGYNGTAWVPLNENILAGPQGPTGPSGPQGLVGIGVPVGGVAGQVLGKVSTVDYDTEWTTPATPAPSNTISWERYTFNASSTWTVMHNKNTRKIIETLTDINGQRFYAGINIIDTNSFEVVLTEAVAGVIDVIFG